MKKQRGMTLIEVMVAMLVLSIAMIGGISFFTSAYRINYSYLESANRLDHALRYVEKLKVQRRNYPTKGYFPNIGGNGFTAFYINSETLDTFGEPYFYENYSSMILKLYGKVTALKQKVNSGNDQHGKTTYYTKVPWDVEPSTYVNVANTDAYHPHNDASNQRLNDISQGNFIRVTGNGTTTDINTYLKYSYDNTTQKEIAKEVYTEVPFERFITLAKNSYSSVNTGNFSENFYFSQIPPWLPNAGKNLYMYKREYYREPFLSGGAEEQEAWGQYQYWTNANIFITPGAELDENSETGGIGSEVFTYHSLRFYSADPRYNANTSEILSLRTTANIAPLPFVVKKAFTASDKELVKIPPAEGYGSDVLFAARIHLSPNGRERVQEVYRWNYSLGSAGYPANTNLGQHHFYEPIPDNVAYFEISQNFQNPKKITKIRRSAYMSVYPIPTKEEADTFIKYVETNYKYNLTNAINYMTNTAKTKGYKYILIPFNQLYAQNTNSTLSERLD